MSADESRFDVLTDMLSDREPIEQGKMFGKRCLKVNGNVFAVSFEGDVVFKLEDQAHQRALALEGAELWDPSGKGRAMKKWVQVPATHADLWHDLAEDAISYVGQLPPK